MYQSVSRKVEVNYLRQQSDLQFKVETLQNYLL